MWGFLHKDLTLPHISSAFPFHWTVLGTAVGAAFTRGGGTAFNQGDRRPATSCPEVRPFTAPLRDGVRVSRFASPAHNATARPLRTCVGTRV